MGFAYAIGAAITWGLVYAIDQKILSNTSPAALLFVNTLMTAIVVLPVIFFDHDSIRTLLSSSKGNLALVTTSIILAALANFLIFSGIKLVGASSASLIEISYPFFVVFFSIIFFRIVPTTSLLIGGALIFLGSTIITYFH